MPLSECIFTLSYLAMLAIVMVPTCCRWIELFGCFLLLADCVVLLGTIEAGLQERLEGQTQLNLQSLVPKCVLSLAIRTHP